MDEELEIDSLAYAINRLTRLERDLEGKLAGVRMAIKTIVDIELFREQEARRNAIETKEG